MITFLQFVLTILRIPQTVLFGSKTLDAIKLVFKRIAKRRVIFVPQVNVL